MDHLLRVSVDVDLDLAELTVNSAGAVRLLTVNEVTGQRAHRVLSHGWGQPPRFVDPRLSVLASVVHDRSALTELTAGTPPESGNAPLQLFVRIHDGAPPQVWATLTHTVGPELAAAVVLLGTAPPDHVVACVDARRGLRADVVAWGDQSVGMTLYRFAVHGGGRWACPALPALWPLLMHRPGATLVRLARLVRRTRAALAE